MLGSVSEACKVMRFSRNSFYWFNQLYDKGGELAVKEISRRKPCLKNRLAPQIETFCGRNDDRPTGLRTGSSSQCVDQAWFVCFSEWSTQRMVTIRSADLIPSSSHGEGQAGKASAWRIETAHPGYLGAQDTYYVGTIKASAGFISRHSSTRIRRSLSPSPTIPRMRRSEPIC
jgi:hypothetical protein